MKIHILAGVAAMALATGASAASAPPPISPTAPYDQSMKARPALLIRPFDQAKVTAQPVSAEGDEVGPTRRRDQHLLLHEPGYTVGIGAARIGGDR